MGRPPCCGKANVKRGPWTPEEDAKILAYVASYGIGNWTLVPQEAGLNRCGKSCRLRWTNYLHKHGNFTPEEEECILEMHKTIGSRWSLIARQLPGRTDKDVKNYWNTKLKKKLSKSGIDPITKLTTRGGLITSLQADLASRETALQERDGQLRLKGEEFRGRDDEISRLKAEMKTMKSEAEMNDLSSFTYVSAVAGCIRVARNKAAEPHTIKNEMVPGLMTYLRCNVGSMLPIANLCSQGLDLSIIPDGVPNEDNPPEDPPANVVPGEIPANVSQAEVVGVDPIPETNPGTWA